MEVVKYMCNTLACFSRVRLVNDEQVMVSMAQTSVRVLRMKWGGIVPAGTLWEGSDRVQMGLMFRCSHDDPKALLDGFTNLVLLSTSADDVRGKLRALDEETRPLSRRPAPDAGSSA